MDCRGRREPIEEEEAWAVVRTFSKILIRLFSCRTNREMILERLLFPPCRNGVNFKATQRNQQQWWFSLLCIMLTREVVTSCRHTAALEETTIKTQRELETTINTINVCHNSPTGWARFQTFGLNCFYPIQFIKRGGEASERPCNLLLAVSIRHRHTPTYKWVFHFLHLEWQCGTKLPKFYHEWTFGVFWELLWVYLGHAHELQH